MIDLHCHVLPGIDDGPETIEGSLALARAAASAGVETLVATPHVNWRYPNDGDTIADLVEELSGRLAGEEIPLRLLVGAEIAMTQLMEIEPSQLPCLCLGGSEWLLIEPPFTSVATPLAAMLEDLQGRGHRVLLAHPERCAAFHRDPRLLRSLVQGGVLTSLTAGSLVGDFGGTVKRFALKLMEEELVHNVASDAHDLTARPPGMRSKLEQAGLTPLAQWLTEEVPAAILGGQEIPPRPPLVRSDARRGRRWRPRRR